MSISVFGAYLWIRTTCEHKSGGIEVLIPPFERINEKKGIFIL